jgi:cardiolipin synthase
MSSGLIRRRRINTKPPRDGTGVNTRPGSNDDGYRVPPPVTLADGSSIRLLKDGQALRAAYDAIASAKRRICLEFYIFLPDATGSAFLDLLERKAREGVEVYVIYDSFGSFVTRERFRQLRAAGARVAEFHPLLPWELRFGWRPFNRDHRKLVVVDDEIAGVGGLNIADPYAGQWVSKDVNLPPERLWRDTAVGVRGPSARMFLRAFAKTWHYIHHGGRIHGTEHLEHVRRESPMKGARLGRTSRYLMRRFTGTPFEIFDPGPPGDDIGVFAHAPTLASPLRSLLTRLIRGAHQSIDMTMAYFAPDDDLIGELCTASARGVRVRLMMAAKSDLPIMTVAARAFYDRLLCHNVEIYERQRVVLHAKTLCIDDAVSIVGSTNLDYRSIEANCEISAIIRSPQFGQHMRELFEHDMLYSKQITREVWQRWPVRDRMVMWMVTRLRQVL